MKDCNENQIRNPKTNRCVLKTSALGKQILKDMKSSPRRTSPRRVSPRRAASPKKQKPCRSDQIRNPETGRCVLRSSPKGKQILKNMGSSSRRDSSPRRRDSSPPRRASSPGGRSSTEIITNLFEKFEKCKSLKIIEEDGIYIEIDGKEKIHIPEEKIVS